MSDVAPSGSPFWRFSLQFYRLPQIAEACLALQEAAHVDVNLLLFLLWHARQRRQLSPAEVASLDARIAPWRELTVIPLRTVRRGLKTPPALVDAPIAEAFRNRIKAVELEAERLQQEAMYGLAPFGTAGIEPDLAARANITAYQAMMPSFPSAAVAALLAAFAAMPTDDPLAPN